MKVAIRVDAGHALGFGHLVRCRSLAKVLLEDGPAEITWLTDDPIPGAFSGIEVQAAPVSATERLGRFDLAVLDVPGLSLEDQQALARQAGVMIQINDSDPGPFAADVLVRPNLLGLARPKIVPEGGAYLTGGEFLILDPAYGRAGACADPGSRRDILVCFGGSDPRNFTEPAVRLLAERVLPRAEGGWKVHVVLGPAYPRADAVRELVSGNKGFSLSVGLPELSRVFSTAGIALVSGGTLLYEACASGVPALVLCQNEAQRAEALILHAQGAALCLDEPRLEAELLNWLGDPARLSRIGRSAASACRTGGAYRIWSAARTLIGAGRK